jgi:hypothetical protein
MTELLLGVQIVSLIALMAAMLWNGEETIPAN